MPEDGAALTDIERAQLIAMVETILAMLKGPMIETSLINKLKRAAQRGAEKTTEKGVEKGLGNLMTRLSELLSSFLQGS